MKTRIGAGIFLFVLGVFLGLVQLWFAPWSPEVFLKLELTVGALLVVVVVVQFMIREYGQNKAMRDDAGLDD